MARRCSLLLLVFVIGCGDRVEPASSQQDSGTGEIATEVPDAGAAGDVYASGDTEPGGEGSGWDDASVSVADGVSQADGAGEEEMVDGGVPPESIDVEEETEEPPPEPEWDPVFEGETIGSTVIFYPEALEGIFLFGLSAEFGTALTQLGNTAAGVIMIPVVVDLHHGKARFQSVDPNTGEVETGDDGLVLELGPDRLRNRHGALLRIVMRQSRGDS